MNDGTLIAVDAGIWAVNSEMRLMPGLYLPVTSHVVRLASGGLLLHSPVNFSEDTVRAIRKIGEVEKIFAPSLGHVTYLKKAHATFAEADLLGPVGLEKKLPTLSFAELLGEGSSGALGADFEHVLIGGAPSVSEVVLRHRASGCLIVADYFFNIQETRGLFTRPVLRYVSDALGKPTQSKLWRMAVKDRKAARASAREVLALDFQRVLVGHGQPIESGREMAEKSLNWLIQG